MKNIADVNSDDILTELNNLDYDDSEDLKLLDDEDIRPIGNKSLDDDLSDFYMDYEPEKKVEELKPSVNLYTEKVVEEKKEEPKIIQQPKSVVPEQKEHKNIDAYLNRVAAKNNIIPEERKNTILPKQPIVQSSFSQSQVSVSTTPVINTKPVTSYQAKNNEIEDFNQLFNKVSNNVKGASEIVNRNAEIKKKMEIKLEELKKMQSDYEETKKRDYAEINAYKDEVYAKVQQKKSELEKDFNSLKLEQEKFEKEKKAFEEYKKSVLDDLNKREKEFKLSYDSRNSNIEQVELGLVKRKEQLDRERIAIQKEKEQVKMEKEELTKNLVQFNKLVSEFKQDIGNFE